MAGNNQLYYLMQLAGGTFPSGGFSQSWGLETYVAGNQIKSAEAFRDFVESYLSTTISRCEGPILCEAYRLAEAWDSAEVTVPIETLESAKIATFTEIVVSEEIASLEELSCACKVTRESRESSLRMGKAFLRITADILEDERTDALKKKFRGNGMTYPVVFGLVCGLLEVDMEEAVRAFVFSTVNGLVQSAVKLIPLGNTEAQKVLLQLQPEMEQSVQEALEWPIDQISNFCPGFDIASILHETLPVRLYMS